jgi:hypothetical protein
MRIFFCIQPLSMAFTSVHGTFRTSQAVAATSDVEGEADEGRAPLDFRI